MHVHAGKKRKLIHILWEDYAKELAVINRSSCISKNIIDINQSERKIKSHMAPAFDYPDQDYI